MRACRRLSISPFTGCSFVPFPDTIGDRSHRMPFQFTQLCKFSVLNELPFQHLRSLQLAARATSSVFDRQKICSDHVAVSWFKRICTRVSSWCTELQRFLPHESCIARNCGFHSFNLRQHLRSCLKADISLLIQEKAVQKPVQSITLLRILRSPVQRSMKHAEQEARGSAT